MCVSFSGVSPFIFTRPFVLGFLPVLYALFLSHRKSGVQLPSSDSDDPAFTQSDLVDPKQRDLHGWRILLLWIPAACDLTGTTVSCRDISVQTLS